MLEAKAFNYQQQETAFRYGGCVGTLMCETCGTINSGTCLCMGIFTCKNCGYKQKRISETFAKAKHNFPLDFFKPIYRQHEIDHKQRICNVCGLSDRECAMEVTKECYGSKRNLEQEIEQEREMLEWI